MQPQQVPSPKTVRNTYGLNVIDLIKRTSLLNAGWPKHEAMQNALNRLVNRLDPFSLKGKTGAPKAVNVKGRIAVNTVYFARQATISGLGIALLPQPGTMEDLKAGRLKVVLANFTSITDGIYVTYPSRQHLPAKVRVFFDFVVEKLKPQPPWDTPQ